MWSILSPLAIVPGSRRIRTVSHSLSIMVQRLRRPLTIAKKRLLRKGRAAWKTILRLPDLDQAKSAVLNSLSSTDAQRGYRHAMHEFLEWYCSEPRLSFNRTVALRYRTSPLNHAVSPLAL